MNIQEIINQASVLVVNVVQENFNNITQKNTVQKKDGSFVTDFDMHIDQDLTKVLKNNFLDINFISEESQDDTSDIPGLAWCIDPIDGTHNFMMNIPYYAVSVGLLKDGNPIAGIIYNPILQQLLVGGEHIPVTLNNRILKNNNESFIVTTNRSHKLHDKKIESEYIQKIIQKPTLKYRRLGSCALDIMNIVLGNIGATYIIGNSKWDWSAGYAIAKAAGYSVFQKNNIITIFAQHLEEHMVK